MLRVLVLALVLANAAYWAWAQGALAAFGFARASQSEPQRLAQQVKPQAMRLLGTEEARRAEAAPVVAAPAKAAECLMAGLFDTAQTATLRAAMQSALPEGSWVIESGVERARWIIYMGKYPAVDALARKKAELRQLSVAFEEVAIVALRPGLALGGFDTQAAANTELAQLAQRGVRTARVVQERAEVRGQFLKFPAVDAALKPRLEAIKPQLGGKALRACL